MLSLDMADLSTIVEEDMSDILKDLSETYGEADCAGYKPTIHVSPTSDDPNSTTIYIPLVSQTPPVDDAYPSSDDDMNEQVAMTEGGGDFDSMTTTLNNQFDRGYNDISAKLVTSSWHPLELIKNKDTQSVDNYIIGTDLGKLSNRKHHHWARVYLLSLIHTQNKSDAR